MRYLVSLRKIGWALDAHDTPDPPLPNELDLEVEATDHDGALRAAYDVASDRTGYLIDAALERAHPEPTLPYTLVHQHQAPHPDDPGRLLERHYRAPGGVRVRVRLGVRAGLERDTVTLRGEAAVWCARAGWLETVASGPRTHPGSAQADALDALAYELLGVTDLLVAHP